MRGLALILVVAVVATGCLGPEHPDLESIPGDQSVEPATSEGRPLVLFSTATYHDGSWSGGLFPNTTDAGPEPAACVFYWHGHSQRAADCSVEDGLNVENFTRPDGLREVPWTIDFDTEESFTDAPGSASVYAFARNGTVLASWHGERAADVAHATE